MGHRFITFKKVHNFRDIGGLPTNDGHIMKHGMIFRSDSLHTYSKPDFTILKNLGIKSIIDLRTPWERLHKEYDSFDKERVKLIRIPIYPMPDKKDLDMKKHLSEMLKTKNPPPDFESFMLGNYHRMAFEHADEINQIIHFLSEESNLPAIVHCSAGKDRTGWISFLLQSLSGVTHDSIFEDYMLTNQFLINNKELKRQKLKIALLSFGRYNLDIFKPILEARREYLNSVSVEVKSKYGTVEKYLTDYCKVSVESIVQLKTIFS